MLRTGSRLSALLLIRRPLTSPDSNSAFFGLLDTILLLVLQRTSAAADLLRVPSQSGREVDWEAHRRHLPFHPEADPKVARVFPEWGVCPLSSSQNQEQTRG